MKKKQTRPWWQYLGIGKILRIMKVTFVLMVVCGLSLSAAGLSQNKKLTLSVKNATLLEIFKEIEANTDLGFLYKNDQIDQQQTYTVDAKNEEVHEVLSDLLDDANYTFTIIENNVVITKVQNAPIILKAQEEHTVKGTVIDANGEPLPGVNVYDKANPQNGVITGIDGNYSISLASADVTIMFSFIGFDDQEVQVAGRAEVNITLLEERVGLDEVMVVAYGTSKKASFTGSAAVVKSEAISKVPVTSVEKALSGAIAGVTVAETSGQPGSYSEVRIRGLGSFAASNSPLYVVDGVPISTGSMSEGGNLMSSIPTGDIESVTVLKDAAAASLYGSRAANGVILITTKQGSKGVTKYNLKASTGISDFAVDNYKGVSGEDHIMLHKESLENFYGVGHEKVDETMNRYEWYEPEGGFTDWYDLLFRKGVSTNIELSATGGNDKTQFYISGSYLNQEGLALNSNFLRYSGRVNLTHKVNDKLKFGISTLTSHTDQDVANNGSSYFNPFYNVNRNTWPTESPYDENGDLKYELVNAGYYNLLREYPLNEKTAKIFRSMSSAYIEYQPITSLTFRSTNSYDWINNDYVRYGSPISRSYEDVNGYIGNSNSKRIRLTSSNLLTFEKTFADQHNLNVIGAFEAEKYKSSNYGAEGEGLPNESLKVLSVAAMPVGVSGYSSAYSMLSYLSRVNYDFNNKYYLSGSIRRDGSSRLGENERWADFWSVSGAWRITEEEFMSDLDFLDNLKVRASYGTNGTLPPGYYDHLALYSYTGAYDGTGAAVEDQIASPNLTWEKNKTFNIGIEYGIFNRIRGSVEYFERNTSDLIMDLDLAPTIGAGSTMVNIGEMQNKGIEIELRTDNIVNGNFRWSTTFLFSRVRNEIVKLAGGNDIETSRYIRREGLPYYSFYMPIWAGVDPADGSPMWYVIDENENITDEVTHDYKEAESAVAGSAEPDFYGSITNELSYKGFNLSFLFNYSVGGKIWYNSGYKSWNDGRSPKYVIQESQLDRWQKPGDIAKHPQRIWTGNNGSDIRSTRFLFDNNYLRLKDITLSYDLPTSLLSKVGISNMKTYVQGRNLLTFASQDIVDPEHGGANGYAYFEMPPVKTISFGIEIGF